MFDKIQQFVGRAISGYEAQKLIDWVDSGLYSEEDIINAYSYCEVKTLNYIAKYLENHKKNVPEWFNKEIKKEETDIKAQIKMLEELKEFYDNKDEWEQKIKELKEQ